MLPQTPGGLKLARALLLRQEDSSPSKPSPERRYRGSAQQHSFTYGQTRGGQWSHNGLDIPKGSATQRSFAYGDTHRRRERRLATLPTLDEVILEGLSKRSMPSPSSPHQNRLAGDPPQAGGVEERPELTTRALATKSEKALNWKKAKALMIRSVPTFSGRGAIGEENELEAEPKPGDRPGPVAVARKVGEANPASPPDVRSRPRYRPPLAAANSHAQQQQASASPQRHQRRASGGGMIDRSPLSLEDTIRLGLSKRAVSGPLPYHQPGGVRSESPRKTDLALSEFFQQQLGNSQRVPVVRTSGSERSFTYGSLDTRRHVPRGSATETTFTYGDGERRMRCDNTNGGAENMRSLEEVVIRRFAMRAARAHAASDASRRDQDKTVPTSHKKPPLPPRKGPQEPSPPCPSELGAMSPGLSISSSSSNNSTQEFSPTVNLASDQKKRWYRFLLCGALRECD